MNKINFMRELVDGYTPTQLLDDIHIVGVGAIGSKVCQGLFQMGLPQNGRKIHIYDFDKVESHNVSNQAYGVEHIGMFKVEAMKSIVEHLCGDSEDLIIHNEPATGNTPIGGIVVLSPDTIKARRDIMTGTQKYSPMWWVDCRMTTTLGYAHTLRNEIALMKRYGEVYLKDIPKDSTPVQGCGVPSVGCTSSLIASLACYQIRKILAGKEPTQILMACIDPPSIVECKI